MGQSWKHFAALWSRFGIKPEEASKILVKNWLEKNYTIAYGNIWRDRQNRIDFLEYVDYVYGYMRSSNIRWRAACLELCKSHDARTNRLLTNLKVPGATKINAITMKPVNFAKLVGQWRQEFVDRGWLDKFDKPEIIIKRIEKTLKRAKLLKKKKKK